MENYTLELALFDYVPVILSGIGLYFMVRWMRSAGSAGTQATLGAALIFMGGFSKATWKLIWVTTQQDISILENVLFLFLGSGFVFLSFALYQTLRRESVASPWRPPLLMIALGLVLALVLEMVFPDGKRWVFAGVGITTIANLYYGITLARHCIKVGVPTASVLLIVNLIGIFVMSGLARASGQTVGQQWMAESANFVTQGCFALAGWLIYKAYIKTMTVKG